jgi:hypothetical protein
MLSSAGPRIAGVDVEEFRREIEQGLGPAPPKRFDLRLFIPRERSGPETKDEEKE